MVKMSVSITNFSSASKDKEVIEREGEFYLEKHSLQKSIVFKRGNFIQKLILTKKSFQNLKRFTAGITIDKMIDIDPVEDLIREQTNDLFNGEGYYPYDDDEMIYTKKHYRYNYPIKKIKEKSPFIVQEFIYV